MPTQPRFTINGLIDTNQPVLQNLDMIATSAGAWFTFDNATGNWSVIINQSGNSTASFGNHNIIGGITVNGTGLRDAYNGVKVIYPRTDIKDNQDFIQIDLPAAEWNANEVENRLEMTLPLVNNQVQAQLIGFRELKQSRVNKVIQFDCDYTAYGIKAGDLIDVTNSVLGLNQQVYRVTSITETDDPDRGLIFTISALLYDADVYDETDLEEYIISDENGIRSVGDIGIPGTPSVTKYEKDARPRLVISTTAPSGIVEGMEFWMAVGNSSGNYTQVGTEYPTGNGVYTQGTSVTLDLDNINAGNVYFKTRGFNSVTTGPFSTTGNLVSYVPLQTTQAIGNNTQLTDANGNVIPTVLALSALMSYLDTQVDDGLGASSSAVSSYPYSNAIAKLAAASAGYTTNDGYDETNVTDNEFVDQFVLTEERNILTIRVVTPQSLYVYEFLDPVANAVANSSPFLAQPAMGVQAWYGNIGDTLIGSATVDWQFNSTTFEFAFPQPGTYTVNSYIIPTYILNQDWVRGNITEGQTVFPYDFQEVPIPDATSYSVSFTLL